MTTRTADSGAPKSTTSIERYVAPVLAVAWLWAAVWARWSADSLPSGDDSGALSYVLAAAFGAASIWALCSGPGTPGRGGAGVAALLFAVVASATPARDGAAAWDAAAVCFSLLGVRAASGGARRLGVVLPGIGAGCSPVVLSSVLCVPRGNGARGGVVLSAVTALAVAAATALLIQALFGRFPRDGVFVPHEIAALGPQNVWREWAAHLDLAAPVGVLALLGVLRIFAAEERHGDVHVDGGARVAAAWFIVNALAAVILPRVFVAHALPFLLPAFVLVARGWCVMRELPLRRRDWSLSVFSVACYVLLAVLAWTPIRKTGELILIALYP